ncbi:hypothetical protein FHG87_001791 [Trinorchestia longiramus]|nr:hypothetical protein FHG87_001791 [Trinorchestia longiramus]
MTRRYYINSTCNKKKGHITHPADTAVVGSSFCCSYLNCIDSSAMKSAVVLVALLLNYAAADDAVGCDWSTVLWDESINARCALVTLVSMLQFSCCMGGWKVLHGVTQCPLNCCHGYEERVLQLPRLQYPVVCHKLTPKQLLHKIRLASLATATPAAPPASTTPPPRLPPASLRHLRDISELLQELTEGKGAPEVTSPPPRDRNERDLVQMQQRSPRGTTALLKRHALDFKLLLATGISKEDMLQAFNDFLEELLTSIP